VGPAQRRAIASLDEVIEHFRAAGFGEVRRVGPFEARLAPSRHGLPIRLRIARDGRVFGGTYALELSTAEPVLPRTRGVSARGRGIVRLQGIAFRPRRGDKAGRRLADRLATDRPLSDRLSRVHFERIRIEPDGRATIRHLGGSVVWVLFPPLVKAIPLVPEQVAATLAALDAFADAGAGL
jgi:hypothetical protein